jgi:hypothetical protein
MDTPTRCPLCGETNECGVAAGKSTCWCFSTPVPPEVLAQVPEDQQGRTCVCERCAAALPGKMAGTNESI